MYVCEQHYTISTLHLDYTSHSIKFCMMNLHTRYWLRCKLNGVKSCSGAEMPCRGLKNLADALILVRLCVIKKNKINNHSKSHSITETCRNAGCLGIIKFVRGDCQQQHCM